MLSQQFLTIHLCSLGVEARDFFHQSELDQDQPSTEHIRFVDVMLSESRITVYHMRLPQDRREILRSSPDGRHGKSFLVLIVRVVEVVLAFSKVNNLHLVIGHEEEVGGLDVTVTDAFALQK